MDTQIDLITKSWEIHPLFGLLAALVIGVFAFLLIDRKSLIKEIHEFKNELRTKNAEISKIQEHHYEQVLEAQREMIETTRATMEVITNLKEVFQTHLTEIRNDLKSMSHRERV